jgi:hypothetical protein
MGASSRKVSRPSGPLGVALAPDSTDRDEGRGETLDFDLMTELGMMPVLLSSREQNNSTLRYK